LLATSTYTATMKRLETKYMMCKIPKGIKEFNNNPTRVHTYQLYTSTAYNQYNLLVIFVAKAVHAARSTKFHMHSD